MSNLVLALGLYLLAYVVSCVAVGYQQATIVLGIFTVAFMLYKKIKEHINA